MTPKLTIGAKACLILALDGTGINFTKFVMGNGNKPSDYYHLTDLVNPLYTIGLNSLTREDDYAELLAVFTNSNVETSFNWTEIGIFCEDPFSTQANPRPDILYAYAHYQLEEEETACATIPKAGAEILEITLKYRIYVGEAENITAEIAESANYASKEAFENHVSDNGNPHEVKASQLSDLNATFLSQYANDMTVTYGAPATADIENIESGDVMSVVFQKIRKAIAGLVSHLADKNNPHGITLAGIGAAAASHLHSAADINSGTLSATRGGTGKSNPTNGAILKGGGSNPIGELSGTGALYATTKNSPQFGTLPASCGGTGSSTLYGSDLAKVRTATLTSSGWSASVPYLQEISVTGITANDAPVISAGAPATKNAANYTALIKNFAMIDRAVTGAGKITFYCYRKKPAANIPVFIKGV